MTSERLRKIAADHGATVVELPSGSTIIILPDAARDEGGDELVPLGDAARIAATSKRVLVEAIRRGELPAFGRQRDRSVRRADLVAWVESRRLRPVHGADDRDIEARVRRLAKDGTP
jgi:hypothetical protein